MLDREGAAGPADIALAGDEAYLRSAIQRLADMGVTDFAAAIADVEEGAFDRTLEFLADYRKTELPSACSRSMQIPGRPQVW